MANVPRLGRSDPRVRYVVGFAFNPTVTRVVLIHKDHGPSRGFNGLGGEVGARESYRHAMAREFKEEAGVLVTSWHLFALIEADRARLQIFRAVLTVNEWRSVRTLGSSPTDEQVIKISARLPFRTLGDESAFHHDVPALVAIARDFSTTQVATFNRRAFG